MSTLVRIVYLLALIVWLGEVLFLSFVVAPAMFRTFAVEEAGRAVGTLFPIYYKIGYGAGAVMLVTALALRGLAGGRAWALIAGLVAVMLAATLYAGVVVEPRARALRPELHAASAPPVKEEFDQLHRRAVQLNAVVLLGGIVVAVISALQLRP